MNAKGKNTPSGQILHSKNPTKATNAMEGFKRKNKGMNTKQNQNLDPLGSPHLEEERIGGMVDLDLLS